MNDHLFGCIQGFIIFFVLCLGTVIGWYSRGNTEKEEKMTKSDAYVRDHLLIQFMLHNYSPISFADQGKRFEEDVYHHWVLYLKKMEEEHAKRSEI